MKANILVVGDGEWVCLCFKHFGDWRDELPVLLRTALHLGRDNWDYAEGLKDIIFRYMPFDYTYSNPEHKTPQIVVSGTEPVITVDIDTQSVAIGIIKVSFCDYVNYNYGWNLIDSSMCNFFGLERNCFESLSEYGQKALARAAFPCCADEVEWMPTDSKDKLYAEIAAEAYRIGWRLDSYEDKGLPPEGQEFDEYNLPVYSLEESKICANEMDAGKRARFLKHRVVDVEI